MLPADVSDSFAPSVNAPAPAISVLASPAPSVPFAVAASIAVPFHVAAGQAIPPPVFPSSFAEMEVSGPSLVGSCRDGVALAYEELVQTYLAAGI